MEIRCANCGAVISAPPQPPMPGMPARCGSCGGALPTVVVGPAPGPVNPYGSASPLYGPPPTQFGAPPETYGATGLPPDAAGLSPNAAGLPPGAGGPWPQTAVGPPPKSPNAALAVVGLVVVAAGAGIAVAIAHHVPPPASAAGFPVASLATLSLAQTPEAMAEVTGVPAVAKVGGDTRMDVPLAGTPFGDMRIAWDPKDTSHAKEVYLSAEAPPANDAAIKAKIASYVGSRETASNPGNLSYQGLFFSYDTTSARAAAEVTSSAHAVNPHWKLQVDASWDLVRNAVLGLSVPVTDADLRDWLGRGYTLTALGAIDVTADGERSAAMMQAAFPGVATRQAGSVAHTIAVDHPWFGQAEADWQNDKSGPFSRVLLDPPPGANNQFSNQAAIDACVQAIVGAGVRGLRREEDSSKGTYDTAWNLPDGGEVRVSGHVVTIDGGPPFVARKMPRADFRKILGALDACGRAK